MTSRFEAIRIDVIERKGSFVRQPALMSLPVAWYRAQGNGPSLTLLRAAYLYEQVALSPVEIGPHWRIAGEHLPQASQWMPVQVDLNDPAIGQSLEALGVPAEEWTAVAQIAETWYMRRTVATGEEDAKFRQGICNPWNGTADTTGVYCPSGWMENHSIRDYAKVLRLGFAGIMQEIEALMRATSITDPDFPRKDSFWHAAVHVCDAGILLGRRYADLARAMASAATDALDRTRLEHMARVCDIVPAYGATTFVEAVQSLWLCHILTCGEDGINANSIGRLDQILWPYYQADRAVGRLTRAEAVEIMAEFACKLYLEYDVQAITLGGVDRQGHDAVNELSYVVLDATEKADVIRDLSIRLHAGTPEPFIDRAAELISRGGGIPFLFNDECFIPALAARGISLEDARDYAPIGCVELTIPGKANPHAVSGWFNALKCLEFALFNGRDPQSGEQVGPATGDLSCMTTFEDVYAAYTCQVNFFADRLVYHCNRGELAQRQGGPLPCWSLLTDDCLARGRDITDGGPVYNYHSIAFLGTADTADAMVAVQRCLFEERTMTADNLLDALRRDFQQDEPLRGLLLRQMPKYGNDIDAVDLLAARIADDFIARMDDMRSPLNGRYVVHLFSFLLNLNFGRMVGAMPDGRRAGDPLAYSLSAHQGRDVTGITAMLNSLAKLPHANAAGGSAAILDLDPALVAGKAGVDRLVMLIQTAMQIGVGQLQWNVTSAERLVQAQHDPEHFGNIPVRVAGYSQLFKLIDRPLQDHIIARTKHQH